MRAVASAIALCLMTACASTPVAPPDYDLIIRNGTVYDGSGEPPRRADLGIRGDRIAAIGPLPAARAVRELNAEGMAVAPGFINMLSWATTSLLHDGRSQGDIRQGVTLEIFGEGTSPGPINEEMRRSLLENQRDIRYEIPWTTLGEYLEHLERRGVSPNVASFVGATTVRIHELGRVNRAPTAEELARMEALVDQAMREGALGVGSSLIYAPAAFAKTEELIALTRVAGRHGGMYISHIRDEGGGLLEAVDELITIAREAGVPAEIYHLKTSGRANWGKLDAVIRKVDSARAAGLRITADMYTYPASSTGLDATMPTWVQEGGYAAWAERLRDPAIRARVAAEMRGDGSAYDNAFANAGAPTGSFSFRSARTRCAISSAAPWGTCPGCAAPRRRRRRWTSSSRTAPTSAASTSPCRKTTFAGRSPFPGSASARTAGPMPPKGFSCDRARTRVRMATSRGSSGATCATRRSFRSRRRSGSSRSFRRRTSGSGIVARCGWGTTPTS